MNPFSTENTIERMICSQADKNRIPISGTFELLPLCNMDCKMCFAKMTREQMNSKAPMHDYLEWIDVAKQAKDAGMVFLLLTGGEPFLYPNIKELYQALKKMGLVVSINTNATLITEEIVEYLANDPPRRLNITLYGSNDATYKRLCGNPKGFSQVKRGIQLLRKENIPVKINCSVTPLNVSELDEIYRLAGEWDIPIETAYYMMPAIRENNLGNQKYRLSPKEAARTKLHIKELSYPPEVFRDYVLGTLDRYRDGVLPDEYKAGYTCRAGNSVFWTNYDGTMSACSFTRHQPSINVFHRPFIDCWEELRDDVAQTWLSQECHECSMKTVCSRCAASAYCETGLYEGVPKYHCELTRFYIELLEEKAEEYENI